MDIKVKILSCKFVLDQNTTETTAFKKQAVETQQKLQNIAKEYRFLGMGILTYNEVKKGISLKSHLL